MRGKSRGLRGEGSVVREDSGVARRVEGVRVIRNILNIRCIRTVFYCRYYIILNLLYSIVSRFPSLGKCHFSMDFGSEF